MLWSLNLDKYADVQKIIKLVPQKKVIFLLKKR